MGEEKFCLHSYFHRPLSSLSSPCFLSIPPPSDLLLVSNTSRSPFHCSPTRLSLAEFHLPAPLLAALPYPLAGSMVLVPSCSELHRTSPSLHRWQPAAPSPPPMLPCSSALITSTLDRFLRAPVSSLNLALIVFGWSGDSPSPLCCFTNS